MKKNIKNLLSLVALVLLGAAAPLHSSAQDIFVEERNIQVVSGGATPTISFDVYISASASYVNTVTTPPNNTGTFPKSLNSVDIAFDVDFGTGGSVAPGTNSPIMVSTYAATGLTSSANSVIPGNLSGAMPTGYDSRFKMNMDRVAATTEITTTPVKAFTITVTYPANTLIDQTTGLIRLRTIIGGFGSKWSSNDLTTTGVGIGPSSTQVQPLPVTFSSFTGTNVNCSALLKWSTGYESNSSYYDVESSTDGINYNVVKRVASKNVSIGADYNASVPLTTGSNFFRIRAVDLDGQFKNTAVVTIKNNCNSSNINVSPNPVKDMAKVNGLTGTNTIILIDAIGKQLGTYKTTNANQNINMANFAAGMYNLQVTAADGSVSTLKIVKQ